MKLGKGKSEESVMDAIESAKRKATSKPEEDSSSSVMKAIAKDVLDAVGNSDMKALARALGNFKEACND